MKVIVPLLVLILVALIFGPLVGFLTAVGVGLCLIPGAAQAVGFMFLLAALIAYFGMANLKAIFIGFVILVAVGWVVLFIVKPSKNMVSKKAK